MASLLDQFGTPIPASQIARLREEISPPNAALGRPPFTEHVAFGIDPRRLGAILRAADAGNTREWLILAEEIEELFPHYAAVLAKRRRQVAQLPISVKSADEKNAEANKHAELVRDWLDTKILQRSLFHVLDAVGKGFSVHEIVWETAPGRIRPAALHYRPPHFFELSWEDGKTIWLRTDDGFQDLVPHKFLLHTHRSKSGLVVRSGLTRMVAFLWMFASYTGRDWSMFVQGYGLPVRLGRYGPEASETDKRVLWRAVNSIAGDVAAIIPKSMEMEFVTAADRAAGAKLYEGRADWLNREVSKLVLGSTAGTEAISGGHAVGKEHRQVEEDVEKFDAGLLEDSILQQIIMPMVAFTFGPQEKYPTIGIGRPNEVPLDQLLNGVADLGPQGLKVKASELRDRLQLTAPEEGDETVGGVTPAQVPSEPPKVPMAASLARPILGALITRHGDSQAPLMEALTARLADEAAGALHGLTDEVRAAFEAATDMRDLADRLDKLSLPRKQYGEAMGRGMALAHLVGQWDLVQELSTR